MLCDNLASKPLDLLKLILFQRSYWYACWAPESAASGFLLDQILNACGLHFEIDKKKCKPPEASKSGLFMSIGARIKQARIRKG